MLHLIERYTASIFLQKLKDQVCQAQKVKDDNSTLLGDKNGASSGKLNQIIPKMSLPNEKITRLIHDMHNFRLEIERIRSDPQICDGLKNIQVSFAQTLIRRAYEKIEEERNKIL